VQEEVSVDDAFGEFENSFNIMEDDIQFWDSKK
jgi:hypothetical protein